MQIYFLYHLTHINNLKNILEYGLLSRNGVSFEFIEFEDIADPKVVIRGENKFIFEKNIYDCVRLYFNPKNPMLYRKKEIQDRILILCIDRKILLEKDVIISDGNASSGLTNFYEGIINLKRLDSKVINARFWNNYPDGKRKACAEVLINSKISASSIQKIICNNAIIQNEVLECINKKFNIIVEVNRNYYF